ncbi:MAG: hypothetical protein IJE19_03985 [Clostridia bacterium]|nr:hypothetical protein [Clostridia bacterium]
MKKTEEFIEIDVLRLLKAVWQKIWAVILAAIIFGSATFGFTYLFIEPTYEAKTLLYVNNSNFSVGNTSFNISTSSLSAAQELVNTYIVILKARTSLNEIIEYAELNRSYTELQNMISAAPVNSTEIFEVVVTSTDPSESEKIANAIATLLPKRIAEIVDGSSVRVVDYAIVPTSRSGPSYAQNTFIGMVLGVLISMAIIIIRELFDVFVREEQYLSQTYPYPILAAIPNMRNSKSSGYYASDYSSSSNK